MGDKSLDDMVSPSVTMSGTGSRHRTSVSTAEHGNGPPNMYKQGTVTSFHQRHTFTATIDVSAKVNGMEQVNTCSVVSPVSRPTTMDIPIQMPENEMDADPTIVI